MRKFLKLQKVSASLVGIFDGKAVVNVSNANDKGIVISSADVRISKATNDTSLCSQLLRGIPSSSEYASSVPFNKPVELRGDSLDIWVPLRMSENLYKDYILGEEFRWNIILEGNDKVGKKIKVKVKP